MTDLSPQLQWPTDEPLGDLIDKWVQEAFSKKPHGCKHPTHVYVACKAYECGRNHAARAALAQPEPEGPTDEELCQILHQAICDFPPTHPDALDLDARQYEIALELRKARAVLARAALAQPEPEGVTDPEVVWDAYEHADCDEFRIDPRRAGLAAALEAAADQVVPPAVMLEYYERNESPVLGKALEIRGKLLAIAAELRGQEDSND